MSETVEGLILSALVLLLVAIVCRQDRRIRYLQHIAGNRDDWKTRCHHCGKPMRDTAALVRSQPGPDSTTRAVFHLDRPACAAAANTTE